MKKKHIPYALFSAALLASSATSATTNAPRIESDSVLITEVLNKPVLEPGCAGYDITYNDRFQQAIS